MVENEGKAEAIEVEDVVSDVVLHTNRHCWTRRELADEVWQLQAETWGRKCAICRIRDGGVFEEEGVVRGARRKDRRAERAGARVKGVGWGGMGCPGDWLVGRRWW